MATTKRVTKTAKAPMQKRDTSKVDPIASPVKNAVEYRNVSDKINKDSSIPIGMKYAARSAAGDAARKAGISGANAPKTTTRFKSKK